MWKWKVSRLGLVGSACLSRVGGGQLGVGRDALRICDLAYDPDGKTVVYESMMAVMGGPWLVVRE